MENNNNLENMTNAEVNIPNPNVTPNVIPNSTPVETPNTTPNVVNNEVPSSSKKFNVVLLILSIVFFALDFVFAIAGLIGEIIVFILCLVLWKKYKMMWISFLISLLGIIFYIVAVVIAAKTVVGMLSNAQTKAFASEASSMIDGAKVANAQASILFNENITCIPLTGGGCSISGYETDDTCKDAGGTWKYSVDQFYTKDWSSYSGSVYIDKYDNKNNRIWVSNGKMYLENSVGVGDTAKAGNKVVSSTCGQ